MPQSSRLLTGTKHELAIAARRWFGLMGCSALLVAGCSHGHPRRTLDAGVIGQRPEAGSGAPAGDGTPAAGFGGPAGASAAGAFAGVAGASGSGTETAGAAGTLLAGVGGAGGAGGASGQSGSAGVAAGACTGKPGAMRGKSTQMLMAAGMQRSFIYYAPTTLDANTPAPIVIVPHGYTMNADMMFEITHYSDLADKEKFIVMFPNGQPGAIGPWNIGGADCQSSLGVLPTATGDDQAFVDAMLKFAEADQCVDHAHIFMTGFSMGAYFSNDTGCQRSDIRAIGPHSGGVHDVSSCKGTKKPVFVMHFQGDTLIPYMCGSMARDRWVARNGCQPDNPDVQTVKGGRCEYYKGCPADAQVAMCTFMIPAGETNEEFKGHGWSGGSVDGPAGGKGFAIPETESATTLSWNFFKKYAW